jgi:hypothetical protein
MRPRAHRASVAGTDADRWPRAHHAREIAALARPYPHAGLISFEGKGGANRTSRSTCLKSAPFKIENYYVLNMCDIAALPACGADHRRTHGLILTTTRELVAAHGSTCLSEKMNMNAFKQTLVAIAAGTTLGATGLASTRAFVDDYGYGYGSYGAVD